MSVFSDPKLVDAWLSVGEYPAIHRALVGFVAARAGRALPLLDLCSSTGLLGRALKARGFRDVYGYDGDRKAVELGRAAGVYSPTGVHLWDLGRLSLERLAPFQAHLAHYRIRTVVARRCLPELSEVLPIEVLGRALVDAGVTDVFVEGRVVSARSTHPLAGLTAEIAALDPHFGLETRAGQLAHLRSTRPATSLPAGVLGPSATPPR